VGALIVRNQTLPLWARVRELQNLAGAVPSPFDCWLVTRGLSTLAVRQREAVESAGSLATEFVGNPAVERVLYPGLPSHPGHAIAARQMTHFGSLLSILVRGGESAAARVIARVRLWSRATSFGGVHSLIEHRYLVEGVGSRTPPNLLRLSVGLEDPRDLREDLEAALRSD
jgi:cystathionine gamma-synthase